MIPLKTRQFLRNLVLDVLGAFSSPAPGIHILNGHRIIPQAGRGTSADRERFSRLLAGLSRHCDFVKIERAIELITNHIPVNRPTVAFTFDDGFEDCHSSIAPVLESFGTNALFFINPNFADAGEMHNQEYIDNFTGITTDSPGKSPMSWSQMKDLIRRGFLIGAHTMDHNIPEHGTETELIYQIKACRQRIEERLEVPCDHFAWPYGRITDINDKALSIACQTYQYVFSQSDYKHYFSFGGKVINRRHFEPWWPARHLHYFLSCKKN